jgi:hypothetical protein
MVLEKEEDNLAKAVMGILEREKEQIDEITLGKQRSGRTDIKKSSFWKEVKSKIGERKGCGIGKT